MGKTLEECSVSEPAAVRRQDHR